MKKATSQDVAELAGVSQATVSLILNTSDKITFSNETKERVLAAAQKLNYRLPQRKKQREKKASNMLLVLTPTLTNQYYAELIQAIEDYADTLDYRVIVCNTFRKPDLEKFYLDTFVGAHVDGIISAQLPAPGGADLLVHTHGHHRGKAGRPVHLLHRAEQRERRRHAGRAFVSAGPPQAGVHLHAVQPTDTGA